MNFMLSAEYQYMWMPTCIGLLVAYQASLLGMYAGQNICEYSKLYGLGPPIEQNVTAPFPK